jgi:hypothetical protein
VRFELTRPFGLPVFKTGAINRSATPPGEIRSLDSTPVNGGFRLCDELNGSEGGAQCDARALPKSFPPASKSKETAVALDSVRFPDSVIITIYTVYTVCFRSCTPPHLLIA